MTAIAKSALLGKRFDVVERAASEIPCARHVASFLWGFGGDGARAGVNLTRVNFHEAAVRSFGGERSVDGEAENSGEEQR